MVLSTSDPQGHARALHRAFIEQHDGRCVLVIDPSLSPLDRASQNDARFDDLSWTALQVPHPAYPSDHAPRLAVLDLKQQRDATLFFNSVQLAFEDRAPDRIASGMGQRIGGWLATEADIDDLAAYWSSIIVQHDDRERAYALRFYDSRALALLWPLLRDGQREVLLGPVQAWHALDACAAPCTYIGGAASHSGLRLNEAQWQFIREHGPVNHALGLMLMEQRRQPVAEEIAIAVAAAGRYEAYDITDAADKALFIFHALTWHPNFDMHPMVRNAMRVIGPDTYYSEAISVLSEMDISAVQHSPR